MKLKYKNLSSSERVMGREVITWILDDGDIMDMVDSFHDRGLRCAVVVWLEEGDVVDAYISDETAVTDEFELPRVREAVAAYDPSTSVCIVVVRENRNAVTLIGDVG